jgi:hypothetical protein
MSPVSGAPSLSVTVLALSFPFPRR